jgi:3-dehydroquinate synthase
MLESLTVNLAERSYPIIIGAEVLASIARYLDNIGFPKRVALVSNQKIYGLYGKVVRESLLSADYSVHEIYVPDGEEYKTLQTLEHIYDELISQNFDRGSGLIALGGGVIGDMVGFAAATFLRGVPFAQIPTTLLAQVDSSVGGKTAVNHALGKNLIGSFYQPELVLIDVSSLETLEPREISAGLAEVVKYGIIKDYDFFCWLEQHVEALKKLDRNALIAAVKRSCQIKADIVEVDEKEGSIRAFLNYGHTFGHAVETLAGYGVWKHGEAVAIGMVVAAKISQLEGLCRAEDVDRIASLLLRLDLPVSPPEYSLEDYVAAIKRDKKIRQGTLSLVLNQGIGKVQLRKISNISTVFSSILYPVRKS